ncbi:MAG: aminotransferase class I/II-fold pyridoxal phosphate-dependent enzyme, partial [Clostridiales bacterium]|nr:aminotransferase class I/II-fold pyridoxal phosphate-dependent enzyme [Clostridiales bacterium]
MKLNDKLNALESYPFHMPGHKRNSDFNIPCSDIDITEIDGFDNLHSPKGILADLQQRLKKLYRSADTIISVNGSTCGILSAVSAVSNKGDTIIIARNCHKSVYNACYINELNIVYIEPEFNSEFGCFGKISQEKIDNAITQNPNACAVVITSPTYEGIVSNIKCDIPLIIDAAHGAHFGFANWLPEIPNGDIVVTSLHKTLPALTQSAAVNIYNEKYISYVKKYMDIFE